VQRGTAGVNAFEITGGWKLLPDGKANRQYFQ
jgi:hypothetical protein